LSASDDGASLSAQVVFTDAAGFVESLSSLPVQANTAATGSVLLNGIARAGETLSAELAVSDADGLGDYQVRWLRDGVAIDGATGTSYVVMPADAGKSLQAQASFVDGLGFTERLVSQALVANTPAVGALSLIATATVGELLTVSVSDLADADGLGDYAIRWLRDSVTIEGATGSSYVVTAADADTELSAELLFTDGAGYAERLVSDAASVAAQMPTLAVQRLLLDLRTLEQAFDASTSAPVVEENAEDAKDASKESANLATLARYQVLPVTTALTTGALSTPDASMEVETMQERASWKNSVRNVIARVFDSFSPQSQPPSQNEVDQEALAVPSTQESEATTEAPTAAQSASSTSPEPANEGSEAQQQPATDAGAEMTIDPARQEGGEPISKSTAP
jgi:hypothetical protein